MGQVLDVTTCFYAFWNIPKSLEIFNGSFNIRTSHTTYVHMQYADKCQFFACKGLKVQDDAMLGSTYTHTICTRPLYNTLRDTIIIALLVCLLVLIMLHS